MFALIKFTISVCDKISILIVVLNRTKLVLSKLLWAVITPVMWKARVFVTFSKLGTI